MHKGTPAMHKSHIDPSSKEAAAAAETGAIAESRDAQWHKTTIQTHRHEFHQQQGLRGWLLSFTC